MAPSLCSSCTCVHCQCVCHNAAAIDDAEYLDSLPIGYRFDPTDNELIIHYLLKKIKNQTLPKNKISEANIYGDHPKHIVENYPQAIEGAWYFFTSRNRKYVNGRRPNRKAGGGYWKATGPDKVIKDNGVRIGGKKSLVYHEGCPPNGVKTNWMMHEYVVEGYERQRLNSNDMKLDDYVLCKIYYKADRVKEQGVTDQQQPVVASNVQDETLRANPEVENQQLAQQAYEDVIRNLITNQETNPAIDNNVVVRHVDQDSTPATHHVEDIFPIEDSNQHMNTLVQNGDNRHGMVHDQQAGVISHQVANRNSPTILQIQNNVVVQNHQNVGFLYNGMMTPNIRPHQMTSFQRMRPSLADQYSSLTGFNHNQNPAYLPPSPPCYPPLPPRIVHAQPEMYFSSQSSSSHPPPPSGQLEAPTFQEGNDCDGVDLFNRDIELMFNQDGDDAFLDDYLLNLDGDDQIMDADETGRVMHKRMKISGTNS